MSDKHQWKRPKPRVASGDKTVLEGNEGGHPAAPPALPPKRGPRPEPAAAAAPQKWPSPASSPPGGDPQKTVLDAGGAPEATTKSSKPGVYAGSREVAGFLFAKDRKSFFPLFDGKNKVGRDPERDIVLDDPKCSFEQCSIVINRAVNKIAIQPAERSTNPTFIDGEAIDIAERIHAPASFRVGDTEMLLVLLELPEGLGGEG